MNFNLADYSLDELYDLSIEVRETIKNKKLESGDLETMLEESLKNSFSPAGAAQAPYVLNGYLICPGNKTSKSAMAHDCSFVSVEGVWAWNHPMLLVSKMETVGKTLKTVAILALDEKMEITQVIGKYNSSGHAVKSTTTFIVENGSLTKTNAKVFSEPPTH